MARCGSEIVENGLLVFVKEQLLGQVPGYDLCVLMFITREMALELIQL